MKFEKIKPGMILYDVHAERLGNTTLRTMDCWEVEIVSVDAERGTAVVIWNGNRHRPSTYYRRDLERLRAKEPEMETFGFGQRRIKHKARP